MTKALVMTASTPIPSRIPCQIPESKTGNIFHIQYDCFVNLHAFIYIRQADPFKSLLISFDRRRALWMDVFSFKLMFVMSFSLACLLGKLLMYRSCTDIHNNHDIKKLIVSCVVT